MSRQTTHPTCRAAAPWESFEGSETGVNCVRCRNAVNGKRDVFKCRFSRYCFSARAVGNRLQLGRWGKVAVKVRYARSKASVTHLLRPRRDTSRS